MGQMQVVKMMWENLFMSLQEMALPCGKQASLIALQLNFISQIQIPCTLTDFMSITQIGKFPCLNDNYHKQEVYLTYFTIECYLLNLLLTLVNLAGIGNMDCGRGMQNCIQMKTWSIPQELVTTKKIGFLLKLIGN